MNRRTTTKSPTMMTDLDDWDTDPDFVRDMDEIDQRWGSKRTVGSINMNKLIDEVRQDHKVLRDKYDHPSQRDHSDGFGGKYGIQHDRKDRSAQDYNYHEKLSKHTSQEIRKTIMSSSVTKSGVSDAKQRFLEKPDLPPPPRDFNLSRFGGNKIPVEESTTTKKIIREEKSSSSRGSGDVPYAFKSIQEKIDSFKKEFEDIESKIAKKSDLSKVIKKTTNVAKSSNTEYLSMDKNSYSSSASANKTNFTSPLSRRELPNTSIKQLSSKFENLFKDDDDNFKRKTEAKRKEYYDQIRSQVRETRKDFDGFDPIDDDDNIEPKMTPKSDVTASGGKQFSSMKPKSTSPYSRPSSGLSDESLSSKPKSYSRRETTQEEIISRVVKENDRVIQNETKRNVERSSSCHGSSEDEDIELDSVKYIDQKLRSSPTKKFESPSEQHKRRIESPENEIKGAGLMARTLYDYQATESDELSFDVDDLITNIEKVDSGWYKGTITYKDGRKLNGLFPANYVKLLNDFGEH